MPAPSFPRWLLWRGDACAVAALAALALATMIGGWAATGGRNRWIDLDRSPGASAEFTVDINTADWPELVQLPGIGEVLAHRIVERRETVGPFASVDELLQIPGIGQKTLAKFRHHLRPIAQRPRETRTEK